MRRRPIKRKPKIFTFKLMFWEKACKKWEVIEDSYNSPFGKNIFYRDMKFLTPDLEQIQITILRYIRGPARGRIRKIEIRWSNYKHLTTKEIKNLL